MARHEKFLLLFFLLTAGCMEASVMPGKYSSGEELYIEICGECHQTPHPARYGFEQWKTVLGLMNRHMEQSDKKMLNFQEENDILKFLKNFNSKKIYEADTPEAKLYAAVCDGNCHPVPDPGMKTTDQWKMLVKFMEFQMQVRGMKPLTSWEKKTILAYLAKYAKEKQWILDLNSPTDKLYSQRCGQCHALPNPNSRKYDQWKNILREMEDEKGMKPLSHGEKDIILSYMRKHVGEVIKVTGLDSPEAETYKEKCGECHDVKDPRLYTYDQWVEKVKEMIDDYDMEKPEPEENKSILGFLKKQAKK